MAEQELTDDVVEAAEVAGVEREEETASLSPDQAKELDARRFAELSDEGHAELDAARRELEEGGHAVPRGRAVLLSAHFQRAEFHCKDGTHVPGAAVPALRRHGKRVLEPMRAEFGPCTVNSAYRTHADNCRIGGEPNSFHVYTLRLQCPATDLRFARGTPQQWARLADRLLGGT